MRFDTPKDEFDEAKAHRLASDYLPLVREAEAFSHTTALLLLGIPVHTHPEIHVTIPAPHSQARGRSIHGHRTARSFSTVVSDNGMPCVSPLLALTQSATLLSFRELVVAIDHLVLLRGSPGNQTAIIPREELVTFLNENRMRNVARLRAAVSISRIGAESRMETLQHFELARMGIDTLEMQANIYSESGEWIGRFDLVDREKKLIVEYDGEQHRTNRSQYLHDEARLEKAREAGWKILRLHKEDLRPSNLKATRNRLLRFLGRQAEPIPASLKRSFSEPLHHPRPDESEAEAAGVAFE